MLCIIIKKYLPTIIKSNLYVNLKSYRTGTEIFSTIKVKVALVVVRTFITVNHRYVILKTKESNEYERQRYRKLVVPNNFFIKYLKY